MEEVARLCQEIGFDGLELCCWGDHFEVDKALADDGYCQRKRELLQKYNMQVFSIFDFRFSISNHLVGQAVLDIIDERHRAVLPAKVWGDGNPKGVNQRAAEAMKDTARAARRERRERLHWFEHLAHAVFIPARAAGLDRSTA